MSIKMKNRIPVFWLIIFILLGLIMFMSTSFRLNKNRLEVDNGGIGNAAQTFQSAVTSKLQRRTLEDSEDRDKNNKNNLILADAPDAQMISSISPSATPAPPATPAANMPSKLVSTPTTTSSPEATPAPFVSAPTLGERLKKLLNCIDHTLTLEKVQYGEYWLLRNYVRGRKSTTIGCADTITLATNGEYTYFKYLPNLIASWQAPISFAIYAPGNDFENALKSIQYARNCLPESQLIRDYVTFHIFFPVKNMPKHIPLSQKEALMWPYHCEKTPKYSLSNRFRKHSNMTYPINVGRNIARKSANTHFIFTSDIELYPTPNLAQQFLELVERNRSVYLDRKTERVFVLPVFEIDKDSKIPQNKTHLVQMIYGRQAIPFHEMICKICHLVPKHFEWVNASYSDELTLFSQSKREGVFGSWEPFYISDNREPMFDERVTWEGQSNKRIQNYAMCLLHYDYFVLHPAFLVHTPGIKHFNYKSPRLRHVPAMNKLIDNVIKPEYKILYGKNNKCRI